ncbi:hypothetical protein [Bacillus sp. P14.5]|uniref:hypothetical protein n=1 Tax=Bacillus sp. P14.5 TaxID=1983400 RepID=UPI0013B06870|nr:hypothetical protein [Bacillus sp. P14.5]
MILSTLICGYIGITLFILVAVFFQKLNQNEEYGFLHLLMALMYAIWLPIPIAIYKITENELLIIGSVFGIVYLSMLVITMMIQTGHLVHSVKEGRKSGSWEERDTWMFAAFGGPYEVFANVLKGIWALFLAIAFWQSGEFLMASLMSLFSLLSIYYLLLLVKTSMVNPITYLAEIKANPYFINLETIAFFIVLVAYIGINI